MATKKSAPTKATAKKVATNGTAKASASKATKAVKSVTAPAKKTPAKAPATKAPATKAAAKAPAKAAPTKAPAAKAAPEKAPAKKAVAEKDAGPKKLTKSPYDAKFIDEVHKQLIEERANYLKQADAMMAEAVSLTENREPGDVQFDEESGEGDTLAVERERDLALSAQARAAVEEIDLALGRIAAGVYGICRVSGTPIPKERLRAIPWATERVEYKVGGFGRL